MVGRTKTLNADQTARIDWIRREAQKVAPVERRRLVEALAGGDGQIFGAVMDALRRDGLLPGATLAILPKLVEHYGEPGRSSGGAVGVERSLGRYQILRAAGRFRGADRFEAALVEPEARRVEALVVDAGPEPMETLARFVTLRERLEWASHPCLGESFDTGRTVDGRVYFVTDPIPGESIDGFCDSAGLAIDERIELMAQAADAVAHAHLAGLVFRDLSPEHIRVVHSADGELGLIVCGVGIASALDLRFDSGPAGGWLDRSCVAPELAAECGTSIDARADVFSLGAILYGLLTGFPAREDDTAEHAIPEEARFRIREVPIERASERMERTLASVEAHDYGIEIARTRRVDARLLARKLRNDLDYVLAHALDLNRSVRYRDAGDLAADLRRVLGSEPVVARRPTARYVAAKFIRRHPKRSLLAGVVLAGLGAATLSGLGLLVDARLSLIQDSHELERLRSELDEVRVSASRSNASATVERETAERVDAGYAAQTRALAEIDAGALASAVARDLHTNGAAGISVAAIERSVASALGPVLYRSIAVESARVEPSIDSAGALERMGVALVEAGKPDIGAGLLREAVDLRVSIDGPIAAATIETKTHFARALASARDWDGAEWAYREALLLHTRYRGAETAGVPEVISEVAGFYAKAGSAEKSAELHSRAIEVAIRAYGEADRRSLRILHAQAADAVQLGDRVIAEEIASRLVSLTERHLGRSDADTVSARALLAEARQPFPEPEAEEVRPSPLDRAETMLRFGRTDEVVRIASEYVGNDSADSDPETLRANLLLGRALTVLGRFSEADRPLGVAYDGYARLLGFDSPEASSALDALAALHEAWDEAEPGVGHAEEAARLRAGG
ncbi:MAG: hypothetical protein AAGB51_07735 [Planctomycetota bacterium]